MVEKYSRAIKKYNFYQISSDIKYSFIACFLFFLFVRDHLHIKNVKITMTLNYNASHNLSRALACDQSNKEIFLKTDAFK